MTAENSIKEQFLESYPMYKNKPIKINIWGDILLNGSIIAASDLHGTPINRLGFKLPETWQLVQ